ncbi:MAG: cytochrome P450 [Candidatus Dormibacteraeota bacterium]|nr:cytochrome P450 [Candidatus Dormibacteraeota bacterium]
MRRITTPAGDPAWLATGYETVRALLADPRLGRSHPDPENAPRFSESAILQASPAKPAEVEREEHTRMRRVLGRSFSPRRMVELQPRVQAIVDGLLDDLAARTPPADFQKALSFPLPALVISELLGVPPEDRDEFRRWSDDAANMKDGARSRAGLQSLHRYMAGLIESKRRRPAEDVISDLIAAGAEERWLTPEHMITLASGLLFAGHETTVTAIDRGMVLLLTHPEQRAWLERDPELVPLTVEEILRYRDGMLQAQRGDGGRLSRFANADIEIAAVTIRAGDLVVFGLQSANGDPEVFPNPNTFDIRRDNGNSHVTFGYGPHFCLGAPLARLELQSVFGTVFRRFPSMRLAVPVGELQTRADALTGGLVALPVTW